MALFRSAPADWLIVGLGNPGPRYAYTPHNVGFKVIDFMVGLWNSGTPKPIKRFNSTLYEQTSPFGARRRVVLLKPDTFMNESGNAVGPARGAYKVDLDHVLVVHDEIDLPFGEIRVRKGGGMAGHNGLKSLKQGLGTADFSRVRVGVGRPDSTDPEVVSSYVLGRWQQSEREVIDLVSEAANAVQEVIDGGVL